MNMITMHEHYRTPLLPTIENMSFLMGARQVGQMTGSNLAKQSPQTMCPAGHWGTGEDLGSIRQTGQVNSSSRLGILAAAIVDVSEKHDLLHNY